MTDQVPMDRKLDALLDDAVRTYHVPPDVSFDALWHDVEARAFARETIETPRPVRTNWRVLGTAIAASLVLGVFAGRYSAGTTRLNTTAGDGRTAAQAATYASRAAAPYQRETEELLGNTAVLFAALPRAANTDHSPTLLPEQAAHLLTTTRLLLDSPVAADASMRDLLQDLELVLAQVARLQSRRQDAELTLISHTLEARDLVPRIRSAVTDLTSSDY